jgi:hypothetical protein
LLGKKYSSLTRFSERPFHVLQVFLGCASLFRAQLGLELVVVVHLQHRAGDVRPGGQHDRLLPGEIAVDRNAAAGHGGFLAGTRDTVSVDVDVHVERVEAIAREAIDRRLPELSDAPDRAAHRLRHLDDEPHPVAALLGREPHQVEVAALHVIAVGVDQHSAAPVVALGILEHEQRLGGHRRSHRAEQQPGSQGRKHD